MSFLLILVKMLLAYSEFNSIFTFSNEFYSFICFMLPISILLFQLEESPLTFLVRFSSGDGLLQLLSGELSLSFSCKVFLGQAEYSWMAYPFFHPFDCIMHSLLPSGVSAEKPAVYLVGAPLDVTSCFSLAAFKILSLSLVFDI